MHIDLMTAGKIPDPFVADNEKKVQCIALTDWEYKTTFRPDIEMLSQEKVYLTAAGLDTLAQVSLNGQILGKSENMFRLFRWSVKDNLQKGDNELVIKFFSPVRYITEKQAKRDMPGVSQAIEGAPHLRKAPYQFG
jgi:beta-mannosidase